MSIVIVEKVDRICEARDLEATIKHKDLDLEDREI